MRFGPDRSFITFMIKRPKTPDDVDWEAAADAFVRCARNMTLTEIKEQAEIGAVWLDARGEAGTAEAYRRVAAILHKRLMN